MNTENMTAHKSTGPKTPEGKAISSTNSWRHGIYAQFRRFRTDQDADNFIELEKGFHASWNPKNEAEFANVQTLAYCQFWRLKFQMMESTLWNGSVDQMVDLQIARGEERDDNAAETQSLIMHGEHEKELARRKRSINGEYNKAYRELTHLQRIRRQEAALKAKQTAETARVEAKAAQEEEDAANDSKERQERAGEFVSANYETPPEFDL